MPRKKKTDTKLNRSEGNTRKSRATEDRALTQDRVLTDDQRLNEFRQQFFQSALPDIPSIPGYHVCWLTTENPRDSITARMRLGYEPIKGEDIPGWSGASLKSGDWEGCIGVNEMVAFKLPLHLYEAYMKENHYTQPNYEEEKLVIAQRQAEEQASQLSRRPINFELEDGQAELGQGPEPLTPFSETLGEHVAPEI